MIRTTSLFGAQARPSLASVAALRIEVFREYPYLYEGTLAYEEAYLANYAVSERCLVVTVRDGDRVVGAATAMPLTVCSDDVAPPLVAAGIDPERVYYFGESVLLPAYRGQGIGHQLFDHREAAARLYGYSIAAFCAVVRPDDHPARPQRYVPHDAFWTKRGYARRDELRTSFSWRDLGDSDETSKPMVFWLRELP